MRLVVIISTIAMWLFHKHHTNKSRARIEDKVVDTERVKILSTEWEGVSNELAVVEQVFETEQMTHNQAIQNLSSQRYTSSCAYNVLNELKIELGHCLTSNKLQIEMFKDLSKEYIESYLTYESEAQKMTDMEKEFNMAYADWDAKCEGRLSKIHSMRERIKAIEIEIKTLCSNV